MSKEYSFQLTEQHTGRALHHTGKYVVVSAGTPIACQTYDTNDARTTQPLSVTGGKVEFRTAESINSVDVYGYTDQGFAFQAMGLKPGEVNELLVDTQHLKQVFLYPINFSTSNTYGDVRVPHVSNENVTNMYLPNGVLLNAAGSGLVVTTAESGKSIDIGFDDDGAGSGTNDPDGLVDGALFTATGFKPATIGYTAGTNSIYLDLTGGTQEWTSGALFHPASTKVANAEGTDSATTKNGMYIYTPHAMINSGANVSNLTYTFGGTPTAIKGFIRLEWDLPYAPAFT